MNLYRVSFESESILASAVIAAESERKALNLTRDKLLDENPDFKDEIWQEDYIIRKMSEFESTQREGIIEFTCRT